MFALGATGPDAFASFRVDSQTTDIASKYGVDGRALTALQKLSREKQAECLAKLEEGIKAGNVRNASAYLVGIVKGPDGIDLDLQAREQLAQLPTHLQAELLQKLRNSPKVRNPSAWIIKSAAKAKQTIDGGETEVPVVSQAWRPGNAAMAPGPMLLGRSANFNLLPTAMSLLDKKAKVLLQQLPQQEQVELAGKLLSQVGAGSISNPSAWMTKSAIAAGSQLNGKPKVLREQISVESQALPLLLQPPHVWPVPLVQIHGHANGEHHACLDLGRTCEVPTASDGNEEVADCSRKPSKRVTFGWTEFRGSLCLDGLKGDSDDEDSMSTASTRASSRSSSCASSRASTPSSSRSSSRASTPSGSRSSSLMSRTSSLADDSDDDNEVASRTMFEDLPMSSIEEEFVTSRRAASPVQIRRTVKKRVTWGVVDKRVYVDEKVTPPPNACGHEPAAVLTPRCSSSPPRTSTTRRGLSARLETPRRPRCSSPLRA